MKKNKTGHCTKFTTTQYLNTRYLVGGLDTPSTVHLGGGDGHLAQRIVSYSQVTVSAKYLSLVN